MNNFIRVLFLIVLSVLVLYLVSFSIFRFDESRGDASSAVPEYYGNGYTMDVVRKPSEISIFVTGDVMLGRTVMTKSMELEDNLYPFRKVGDRMRGADITFINLENPAIKPCPPHYSGYIFCTDPSLLDGLVYSGVDAVNLSNNHTLNYGNDGLEETLGHLEEKNILATGVGELLVLERKGVTFGFLGFDKSQQANPKLTKDEVDLIIGSDDKVDILVVSMHWGVEYQDKALPGVRNLAKEIVGYGADLIVGHHPHWVQDWEFIEIDGHGRVPVFYSLGNFIFDQMWSEETKKGLAVELAYDEEGNLTGYELLPTYMSSWSQPEFVEGNGGE